MTVAKLLTVFSMAFLLAAQTTTLTPDPPIRCGDCETWNTPREPYRVFANTYYVGSAGLSSVLITSADGHILIDGALPQSAPLIDENIRKVGFRTADVRLILNSHAHFDHAGGIAALQRASGAAVATAPAGARSLAQGDLVAEDPQVAFGRGANGYPPVKNVRPAADGEVLRVGPLAITAHHTPGHTPGGTTWSWRSCEGSQCRDIVYADSLTPVSAPGFRFTGGGKQPDIVPQFRRTIAKVAALPCDILLAPHPSFAEGRTCQQYAAEATKRLDSRIAEEAKSAGGGDRP